MLKEDKTGEELDLVTDEVLNVYRGLGANSRQEVLRFAEELEAHENNGEVVAYAVPVPPKRRRKGLL